jgi:hypothetical protein
MPLVWSAGVGGVLRPAGAPFSPPPLVAPLPWAAKQQVGDTGKGGAEVLVCCDRSGKNGRKKDRARDVFKRF